MKKILVPTDFSKGAENALNYAIDFANRASGQITLLHAYRLHSTADMLVSVERIMEEEAHEQMQRLQQSVQARLRGSAAMDSIVARGEAVALITDLAARGGYSLIVMGTQGATGLKELFMGSTANGVIKHAKVPVLAIPGDFAFRPIRQIAFAIDDEVISHPGVTAMLVEIARSCRAKVLVFHQGLGDFDDGIDPAIDIHLEGVEHSFHYELDEAAVNESINNFVKDYAADLLCMVRRHRGFLESVFHVSVTTREIFNSPVPLLVLFDEG
jgi:nucleotide-binding universal stress UspA family protein